MTWPLYLPNQIIKGNQDSDTVIVCCWTRRDVFLEEMKGYDSAILTKVAAIGNLYTQERGIDYFVRNLLANTNITKVIITGEDKAGAGNALHDLLAHGDKDLARLGGEGPWSLAGHPKVNIREDVNRAALIDLIANVFPVCVFPKDIPRAMIENPLLRQEWDKPLRTMYVFDPPPISVDTLPTNDHLHVIRAPDIPTGYLDMLYEILTFGPESPTHYDMGQKELLDLAVVIAPPAKIRKGIPYQLQIADGLPDFMPFDQAHLEEYFLGITNPEKPEGLSYSYGNRIFSYFGVDQFAQTSVKLAKEPISRSAVISLWDPKSEGVGMPGSPCLNHFWWRIREYNGKPCLHLTTIIRSNDMFAGWPENAYGLRYLQEKMRIKILLDSGEYSDDLALGLGELVIISESAHLYDDTWDHASKIVKEHRKPRQIWDKKGQWAIYKDEGRIRAVLNDPNGFAVAVIEGKTASSVRRKIARKNLVSDVGHALYIGEMLKKAEDEPDGLINES
jgi:thymidylate synthase